MAPDEAKIRFRGKLLSAAMRKNASTQQAGADRFIDEIYAEWKATGKSLEEAPAWLDQRLRDTFLSLKDPPVWVEDEPAWPFFEGKPMVFISQTQMDASPVSKSALSPGETVYLFAARQKYGTGFKMHFQVVSQFAALKSRK